MSDENTAESREVSELEAVLFSAGCPVSFQQLAAVIGKSTTIVAKKLKELKDIYEARRSGIRLQLFEEKAQLITSPEMSGAVEVYLGLENTARLTRAALETLTIIAYRQPVSRPEIDQVRGVSSDYMIRSLLNRGLIREDGRAETVGRPILYATTQDFLLYFGLSSLNDLPPYEPQIIEIKDEEINLLKE